MRCDEKHAAAVKEGYYLVAFYVLIHEEELNRKIFLQIWCTKISHELCTSSKFTTQFHDCFASAANVSNCRGNSWRLFFTF